MTVPVGHGVRLIAQTPQGDRWFCAVKRVNTDWWDITSACPELHRYVGEQKQARPQRYSVGTGSRQISFALQKYTRHYEGVNADATPEIEHVDDLADWERELLDGL